MKSWTVKSSNLLSLIDLCFQEFTLFDGVGPIVMYCVPRNLYSLLLFTDEDAFSF